MPKGWCSVQKRVKTVVSPKLPQLCVTKIFVELAPRDYTVPGNCLRSVQMITLHLTVLRALAVTVGIPDTRVLLFVMAMLSAN